MDTAFDISNMALRPLSAKCAMQGMAQGKPLHGRMLLLPSYGVSVRRRSLGVEPHTRRVTRRAQQRSPSSLPSGTPGLGALIRPGTQSPTWPLHPRFFKLPLPAMHGRKMIVPQWFSWASYRQTGGSRPWRQLSSFLLLLHLLLQKMCSQGPAFSSWSDVQPCPISYCLWSWDPLLSIPGLRDGSQRPSGQGLGRGVSISFK